MSSARRFRKERALRGRKSASATLRCESLESRLNFSGIPLGAAPTDTGEYMLGDVSVTVVFLESKQTGGIDVSTEDWTQAEIDATKAKIDEAMQWWVDTLATQNTVHELNFHINYQYADTPFETRYEPISRSAAEFSTWAGEFLNHVGAQRTGDIVKDIRLFNNTRREIEGTDWAFTIFVADASNDADGFWKNPSSIAGGFSIAGGAFMAFPNGRPASTIAHETAHQFWAMDEYAGSKDYYDHRGYYDTQNTNAVVNNPDPDQIVDSLMLSGDQLLNAYESHTSSTPMFESIGWKDSDGDGIFDVLDLPLSLQGSGSLDSDTMEYRFVGQAAVNVLPNLNTAGVQQSQNQFLQNDITINTVAEVQYRIDDGAWQTAATYDDYIADIDIRITLPDSGEHSIEIRAIDATGAIYSDVFAGSTGEVTPTVAMGANGFLFEDRNRNGVFDLGEVGLSGWTVALVDDQDMPVETQIFVEPDDFGDGDQINASVPGASLSAFGEYIDEVVFPDVFALNHNDAATGSRVFGYYRSNGTETGLLTDWNQQQQLRVDFDNLVSRVSLDAIGGDYGSIGRLEAFDSQGTLIGRYTTDQLDAGEVEAMSVAFDSPQIAYIVVAGQLNTSVRLDNLVAGQPASATTDAFGAFSLQIDIAGDYQLQITAPDGDSLTYFVLGDATADFALTPLTGYQFAVGVDTPAWRNPIDLGDVNNDGSVDMADFDAIRAEMSNPVYTDSWHFLGDHVYPAPFLDPNNDGIFTVMDVIRVLEAIRHAQSNGAAGEGELVSADNNSPEDVNESVASTSVDSGEQTGALVEQQEPAQQVASRSFVTSTSLVLSDWGLGNLTTPTETQAESDAGQREALAFESVTLPADTLGVITADDRILAVVADDFYRSFGDAEEESDEGEADLSSGFWDLP
ncbi:hypothetical protein [Blastopirellula retiformator]|uniref:Dockerin type I repeat protein n=1 Tax=Blastopirellula retiformator TaxID=2527970 RepID=A0A5C5V0J5_9BACT|nr:hypothetical protein [Blastopirellula retiformator]TWT31430.1 hypothetical protein Enr8_33510 [Blastopirellula retiformator]